VAVIPEKGPVSAESTLPGKDTEHRKQPHLCPASAVQTTEVARPAVFTDSLAQWIDLLM
jgi:hypothetical protein